MLFTLGAATHPALGCDHEEADCFVWKDKLRLSGGGLSIEILSRTEVDKSRILYRHYRVGRALVWVAGVKTLGMRQVLCDDFPATYTDWRMCEKIGWICVKGDRRLGGPTRAEEATGHVSAHLPRLRSHARASVTPVSLQTALAFY